MEDCTFTLEAISVSQYQYVTSEGLFHQIYSHILGIQGRPTELQMQTDQIPHPKRTNAKSLLSCIHKLLKSVLPSQHITHIWDCLFDSETQVEQTYNHL